MLHPEIDSLRFQWVLAKCAALTVTIRTELDLYHLFQLYSTTTVLCTGLRLTDANCRHGAAATSTQRGLHLRYVSLPLQSCDVLNVKQTQQTSLSIQREFDEVILLWNWKAAFDPVDPRESGVQEGQGCCCQWCHAIWPKLSQGIVLSESP